eukprot:7346680-Pyramimonas_sp.AAC.1
MAPPFCCPFVHSSCCACCIEAADSRFVSLPPPDSLSELGTQVSGNERAPAAASLKAAGRPNLTTLWCEAYHLPSRPKISFARDGPSLPRRPPATGTIATTIQPNWSWTSPKAKLL